MNPFTTIDELIASLQAAVAARPELGQMTVATETNGYASALLPAITVCRDVDGVPWAVLSIDEDAVEIDTWDE